MAENGKAMFAEERRRQIVDLINAQKKIVIPELCSRFGVSASTVRNDLRDLQGEGKITRTHGGAIINSKSGYEPLPRCKETHMLEAKQAIARRAVDYVEDGDIIAVGTGTTTYEFIKQLDPAKHLTIILHDIHFADYLEPMENYTIMMLGGTLRKGFHYVQMPAGSNYLSGVNIDKAFISSNGIHVKRGVTTPDPALAHDVRLIIEASDELYVLSDSSKFGSVSFSRIVGLDRITALITDSQLGQEDIAEFRNADVDLVIA